MLASVVGGIFLIYLILRALLISPYNKMVGMEEGSVQQWANVESAYQRRADLIPNLVNTVKGYAAHESEVLEAVTRARASSTGITLDPKNLDATSIRKFQEAQDAMSTSLSRLLVTVEKYPDLKANQNFLELQSQLEGTENRINIERGKFNEAVKAFNTFIRTFPNNLVAGFFNFHEKAYFESSKGSEIAPEVKF